MKKLIFILCTLISVSLAGNAAPQGLGAYMSHVAFNIPGEVPYLETYLEILGNTIVYKQNASGKFQGSIQVTMIIRQDSIIKDFRKYELLSPEIEDTTSVGINFIDQQRFSLPNGSYSIDLSIADINVEKAPNIITYPVSIDFPANDFSMSGIQLVNSFSKTSVPGVLSKSGYDFVPYVDNFFPSDKGKITFYSEIYNPKYVEGSEDKFLVSAFIESFETGKMMNDYIRIKKEPSKPVTVLLSEFDISTLPSGNYNLVVNLRDKENKVLTQNVVFFQRSNPGIGSSILDFSSVNTTNTFADKVNNSDTLREYIRSMQPISTELESFFIKSQVETASLDVLKQFFFNFWQTRDELNPEKSWELYKYEVRKVNAAYSTQVKKGYETDMGRVYLKYGPPNNIVDKPYETSGYNLAAPTSKLEYGSIPYQIWHYYTLNARERNKKFVFISSGLSTIDYSLVHSDANGELQNYNWQRLLIRNSDIHDSQNIIDYDSDAMRNDKRRSSMYYNDMF